MPFSFIVFKLYNANITVFFFLISFKYFSDFGLHSMVVVGVVVALQRQYNTKEWEGQEKN